MNLRDLLLPTVNNDYTPQLLQKAAMLAMGALVLLSFTAVNLQALFWASSDWLVSTVLPAVVIDLTNTERSNNAETPLTRNVLLDRAAQLKAEHMAANHYFAHYSPDGTSPWYWFGQVSYQYAHAGENLAIHFTDSSALVEAWMKSPAHRANVVNGDYTEIGVGTAKGIYDGFDTVFVVQLFGTPAAAIQPKAIVPAVAPVEVAIIEVTAPETTRSVLGAETTETETTTIENLKVEEPEIVVPISEVSISPATEADLLFEDNVELRSELLEDTVTTPETTNEESVFSYIATSSSLLPVEILETNQSGETYSSKLESLATQPNSILQLVYLVIGSLVATLLLLSIVIGIRFHRPKQVVQGIALLLLMTGLFYVQMKITSSTVIAANTSPAEVATL